MKKISATDFAALREYASKLDNIRDEIERVTRIADDRIKELMELLNECIDEANGFAIGLFNEADDYYGERSDDWHDGDKGSDYYQWMLEIESCASELYGREFELSCDEISYAIGEMCEAINNVRQTPEE